MSIQSKSDPFRVTTGGMADMKAVKAGKPSSSADDAYETGIGTQFSVETNTRDEDAEMYVILCAIASKQFMNYLQK